jgi:hypothetical protein
MTFDEMSKKRGVDKVEQSTLRLYLLHVVQRSTKNGVSNNRPSFEVPFNHFFLGSQKGSQKGSQNALMDV